MAEIHEAGDKLTPETFELHRAINSIKEELDAVDWYQQRVDASSDEALRAVLAHNRDEEIEHACMVLEWVRRRYPTFDKAMRTYLFTEGDITALEAEAEGKVAAAAAPEAPRPAPPTLGSLKK